MINTFDFLSAKRKTKYLIKTFLIVKVRTNAEIRTFSENMH